MAPSVRLIEALKELAPTRTHQRHVLDTFILGAIRLARQTYQPLTQLSDGRML